MGEGDILAEGQSHECGGCLPAGTSVPKLYVWWPHAYRWSRSWYIEECRFHGWLRCVSHERLQIRNDPNMRSFRTQKLDAYCLKFNCLNFFSFLHLTVWVNSVNSPVHQRNILSYIFCIIHSATSFNFWCQFEAKKEFLFAFFTFLLVSYWNTSFYLVNQH